MCGIVGYVGPRPAASVLLGGLVALEYRGYDSAGIAMRADNQIVVAKKAGRISRLAEVLNGHAPISQVGIGHTRWATHGKPSDANAHPHADEARDLAIVHNGIIENYRELKTELEAQGHIFSSETDSEVLVHLIESLYTGDLVAAVQAALTRVVGSYALVAIHASHDELVAARTQSPLVLGIGDGEYFLASDLPPLLPYTRQVVFLAPGDLVHIDQQGYQLYQKGEPTAAQVRTIDWTPEQAEKNGFPHFMLKEIYEQPQTLAQTLAGGPLNLELDPSSFDRIQIVACGSAYYAGCVGKIWLESLSRVPVEVTVASEYRYADPVVDSRTLVIGISQSGETADTIEALLEAKRRGAQTLAIVNAKGSSLTREVNHVLYIHAGPEIGVASTKAYTAMLAAQIRLALWLGRARKSAPLELLAELEAELSQLPQAVEAILTSRPQIALVASKYHQASDFLFLGRHLQAATALEGALKLKEISYIHAEAYPMGEMKHGPIALIDPHLPVVVLATAGPLYAKTLSNLEEVRARGGKVIAIASQGDTQVAYLADDTIYVPETHPMLAPIVSVVPLQLLAYEIAVALGRDVDQPRNLAKSVTVE